MSKHYYSSADNSLFCKADEKSAMNCDACVVCLTLQRCRTITDAGSTPGIHTGQQVPPPTLESTQ